MWWLLLIIFGAGVLGGLLNALITDNGFFKWRTDKVGGEKVWRPGILGNCLISGVASMVSWGLYGPLAAKYIIGGPPSIVGTSQEIGLTLSSLAGAVLVGVSGARWLTNEIDKNMLRVTARKSAASNASESKASRIAMVTPFQALKIASEE